MTFDYDLFVIGAGSGGVRASRVASQLGKKVAIAEEYRVGGTCVIRGCVPKKLLVYASQFSGHFADAAGYGWAVGETSFDWPTLIANRDREIARLEGIYLRNLESAGVEVIRERAVIEGPHEVRLAGSDRKVTAKVILVATGARPNLHADLPGAELAITSNEAFHLDQLPKAILIGGAGYIAIEFAGIFAGLGVETTILYRGPEILSGFDNDLRKFLHEEYERKGIRIICQDWLSGLERKDGRILARTMAREEILVDQVMLAIGRVPNTEGLGLEKVGVETGPRGEVVVDDYSRSSVPSIFAIGDVTNRVALTPVAIREAMAFVETCFRDNPTAVDYDDIPTAVFSQPELGTVGLTEQAARERYKAIDIYETRFRPMRNTLSGNEERMYMKLVVDAETDRVLGCHILGPDAGELIQVLGIPVKMKATKADFDATVAVHPTAAEELVTLRTKSR